MKSKILFICLFLLFVFTRCQKDEMVSPVVSYESSPMDFYLGLKSASQLPLEITTENLDNLNALLKQQGVNYRVAVAELITAAGSEESGRTVYSQIVGNKQLGSHFVPGDPRREWSGEGGTKITWAIDQTQDAEPPIGTINAEDATSAIIRALGTWDDVKSTDPGLTWHDDLGSDLGYTAAYYGYGGSFELLADIQFCGWGDLNFISGVIGATFTFVFTEDDEYTDIDNNGKLDVAFREVYFEPVQWYWADNGDEGIDVESIALHELGHGLSQGHFGSVFTDAKGRLKVSPRAVMNEFYFGEFRSLQKTDIGGHSSIWGQWPLQ